jgi:hypothetical protein
VCTVIAKITIYQPQGIGNTCRGLAWEKIYMSNDKYMCGETTLGHVMTLWKYKLLNQDDAL